MAYYQYSAPIFSIIIPSPLVGEGWGEGALFLTDWNASKKPVVEMCHDSRVDPVPPRTQRVISADAAVEINVVIEKLAL